MIRLTILYPNKPGSRFDFDYYLKTHMPMAEKLLGSALKGLSVERGIVGITPESPPDHTALCHMLFDSMEAFMAAFMPHAEALQGDVKNYTDVEPVIQFNEILISR